jgi:pimeloyl-ACP methyl ester carboxylesterase
MSQINIDGREWHYSDQGKGLAVVLVHGFPLDGRIWDGQAAALSGKYRVIVPDLPGFGKSIGSRPFSLASLADELHAFLARIGALPCVLGGLSMGGYTAFAFALKYAGDLKGLMLVDTRCQADSAEGKAGRDKMIAAVRERGTAAAAEGMLGRIVAADAPRTRPGVVKRVNEIMMGCPAATVEHALVALRDRLDYKDKLGMVGVPTLILVGDMDVITPLAEAEVMRAGMKDARLVVIKGAGHLSTMEQPEQVNVAMGHFLEGLG